MSEQNDEAAAARVLAATDPLADRFYRPRQIAERTGRHYVSVLKAISAGELKAQKLGRRAIGVRASEVQRWLDAMNRQDVPAERGEAA